MWARVGYGHGADRHAPGGVAPGGGGRLPVRRGPRGAVAYLAAGAAAGAAAAEGAAGASMDQLEAGTCVSVKQREQKGRGQAQ